MIRNVTIFIPVFRKIINNQDFIYIYVKKDSHKEYNKGDILKLVELNQEYIKTGSFIHVEVMSSTIIPDEDGNKIYYLKIKPKLDMRIIVKKLEDDQYELYGIHRNKEEN